MIKYSNLGLGNIKDREIRYNKIFLLLLTYQTFKKKDLLYLDKFKLDMNYVFLTYCKNFDPM